MSTLNVENFNGVNINGAPANKVTATAWVNFQGTDTSNIRDAFNVASVTDNGVGTYTLNFTDNFDNANYIAVCEIGGGSYYDTRILSENTKTISQLTVASVNADGSATIDPVDFYVLVFGGKS